MVVDVFGPVEVGLLDPIEPGEALVGVAVGVAEFTSFGFLFNFASAISRLRILFLMASNMDAHLKRLWPR